VIRITDDALAWDGYYPIVLLMADHLTSIGEGTIQALGRLLLFVAQRERGRNVIDPNLLSTQLLHDLFRDVYKALD
jgi:hypothetical protein